MSYGGAIRSLLLTSGMVSGALGLYINTMQPISSSPTMPQEIAKSAAPVAEPLAAATEALQPHLESDYAALLDASYSLGMTPGTFANTVPLATEFKAPEKVSPDLIANAEDVLAVPSPVPQPLTQQAIRQSLSDDEGEAAASAVSEAVPLPLPRPSTLAALDHRMEQKLTPLQRADTHDASNAQPSFFERLFGKAETSGPAMAYASPETGGVTNIERITRGAGPTARYDNTTAVYDITAHVVYLPDGTKLEAHSGLRERLDDPRYVNERMRGATPPHLYDLTLRESLFHGVQALRLTPVGGEGAIYGRSGLLAHTYMLGPNGDSNGCVSFRNYDAFLRAYRNGQIKRLAVVARLN